MGKYPPLSSYTHILRGIIACLLNFTGRTTR
jgi:hypothetical protein